MKKITVIIFCLMALYTQAQNTFPATGNVGIGTTAPNAKLHIPNGEAIIGGNASSGPGNSTLIVKSKDDKNTTYPFYVGLNSGSDLLWVRGDGNGYFKGSLGIGAASPVNRLQIGSDLPSGWAGNDLVLSNSNGALAIHNDPAHTYIWGTKDIAIRPGGGKMVIYAGSSGNVGIGTSNVSTHKLSVNGTIRAKEILVNTGWSDFVFDNNYKLRPLTEVEQFVKTNKHLPEIPSQKEVEKNGVQLGDISSKLLMKIEELTLYIIELNKKNELQQKEIEKLQNK